MRGYSRYDWRLIITRVVLTCVMTWALSSISFAQQPSQKTGDDLPQMAPEVGPPQTAGAPIEIDGRPVLLIYSSVAGISPEERAANIEKRILGIARRDAIAVESIRAEDHIAWTEITVGNDVIMGITESDAKAAGRPRGQMGAEYAEVIRRTVTTYRREHTWRALLRGIVSSLIATAALVLVLLALFRIRRAIRRRVETWIRVTEDGYSPKSFRSRLARFLVLPLLGTGVIVVMVAVLALLQVYAAFVLRSFPSTRYVSMQMSRWTMSESSGLASAIWNYLPNLVVVAVIVLAARYLIRLNKFIFAEIQEGKLTLRGFYPDWGAPTAKLVRLLIIAATAVVMFPYLPGSNSPAFRGISVFLGVLLSLGSTSAVSHGVAGTILTYMRSFSVGDFVKIGDTIGEVVERNLLVTRIRTQKNEIVTIPNGSVLGGMVMNFSAEARKNGVIFYTTASIGYSAPWKKVHEMLIAAALSTKDVLETPPPFVLQSSLDDFYVSYELNAFTAHPENMQYIYSDLHQNIQDKFNEAGIEINSPHYTTLRDGNRIAIPDEYVPTNYKEPAFEIREVKQSEGFQGKKRARVSPKVPPPSS
jgi:small-conductance mechanosensitive channel